MRELTRSNNPVYLSWLSAVLNDAGIENIIFDAHTALVEGSITAIEKRLMVPEVNFNEALSLLRQADQSFAEDE